MAKNKKTTSTSTFLPCACCLKIQELFINYFSSFVSSARFAYAMSQFHFTAIWAFYHAWHLQFKVSAAQSFSCFGCSSKRYCHAFHLLISMSKYQTRIIPVTSLTRFCPYQKTSLMQQDEDQFSVWPVLPPLLPNVLL
jgi:hypothetical protein